MYQKWRDVNKHLKDLEDSEIPNSQDFIDWNCSDEEYNQTPKRNCLKVVRSKIKSKKRIHLSNIKNEVHRSDRPCETGPPPLVRSDRPCEAGPPPLVRDIKSPVFKLRKPAHQFYTDETSVFGSPNIQLTCEIVDTTFSYIQEKDHVALEKDNVTQEKDNVTQEKDNVTQEKDNVTQEKDHVAQEKDNVTQEKDHVTQVKGPMAQIKENVAPAAGKNSWMLQDMQRKDEPSSDCARNFRKCHLPLNCRSEFNCKTHWHQEPNELRHHRSEINYKQQHREPKDITDGSPVLKSRSKQRKRDVYSSKTPMHTHPSNNGKSKFEITKLPQAPWKRQLDLTDYDDIIESSIDKFNSENYISHGNQKDLSTFKNVAEGSQIFIDDCSSPTTKQSEQVKKFRITTQNRKSETHRHNEVSSMLKRGSDWVKDIENKTPEKSRISEAFNVCATPEAPDSTRKKIKKDGFAGQLQRLIQSWQSNVSMWNHQMCLASISHSFPCSNSSSNVQSPLQGTSEAYSHEVGKFQSSSPNTSPILRRTAKKYRFVSRPHSACYTKRENDRSDEISMNRNVSNSAITNASNSEIENASNTAVTNASNTAVASVSNSTIANACSSKSLKDSLEIQSPSESPASRLSPKTNFSLPKTHKCVKLLRIEWQTSAVVCAMCRGVAECSGNAKEKENTRGKNKFIVLFGLMECRPGKLPEVGCTVKIFAPWQVLEGEQIGLPTIFSSYFLVMQAQDKNPGSIRDKTSDPQEKINLASWTCSCLSDCLFIPSICTGGRLMIHCMDLAKTTQMSKKDPISRRAFSTVRDSKRDSSHKTERYWTILEAIEKCGGLPDIPVSITVRIRRCYHLKDSTDADSRYLLLGQDPSGVYLLIEIPDRPLKNTLASLLQNGVGSTRTLTHLSVVQRITDNQNPRLFSVIRSLQSAYNTFLRTKPILRSLLQEQLKRPPQSFCYKFSVSLGQTLDIRVAEVEAAGATLPRWNLGEALEQEPGSRGCVSVNILYFFKPYMYTTCALAKDSTSGGTSRQRVFKITVKGSCTLPSWLKSDGTIMAAAVIEDIALWKDCLYLDEFCNLQRIKSELSISFQYLFDLIPQFEASSEVHDLVTVAGLIVDVNTADARSWAECEICGGLDLCTISRANVKCKTCGTECISTITKYSLEIILVPDSARKCRVCVKLFQTTIRNMLKKLPCTDNRYQSDLFLGAEVGPLICILKSTDYNQRNMASLYELPY